MPGEWQKVAFIYTALAAGALAVVLYGVDRLGWDPAGAAAFEYGLGLFTVNALFLAFFVRRFFDGAAAGVTSNGGGLALPFLMRLSLLGLGSFIGIVTLRLSALWFVAGCTAGLTFITVASFARPKGADIPR